MIIIFRMLIGITLLQLESLRSLLAIPLSREILIKLIYSTESTGGSFRVRKDDVSADEWAALNPDDKTGTIIWDDVVEISIGVHSWQSFENFNRAEDSTYSDSEQRVEYFELIENEWGDSWPDRVGVIETQGSLQRVYDRHWELVGSQTDGQVESVSLMSVLNDTDRLIAQFREALGNMNLRQVYRKRRRRRAWFAGSGRSNNSERLLSRGHK